MIAGLAAVAAQAEGRERQVAAGNAERGGEPALERGAAVRVAVAAREQGLERRQFEIAVGLAARGGRPEQIGNEQVADWAVRPSVSGMRMPRQSLGAASTHGGALVSK